MNEKFWIGEAPDPVTEVRSLLRYNDFLYEEENGTFTLRFSDREMQWKTVITTAEHCVLIYGIYPFPAAGGEPLLRFLSEVNRQAVSGAMITKEENGVTWLMFRTGSDLFDIYSAYETIGRDLEYNAAIITAFWNEAAQFKLPYGE